MHWIGIRRSVAFAGSINAACLILLVWVHHRITACACIALLQMAGLTTFTAVQIILTALTPSPLRGRATALAVTTEALLKALGPPSVTSLFAWCVGCGVWGSGVWSVGCGVWYVGFALRGSDLTLIISHS